jgi:uncharacterized protein (DUF302 family)
MIDISRKGATIALIALLGTAYGVGASGSTPHPGSSSLASPHGFAETVARIERATANNGMGVVAKASASAGAAQRGIRIAGNAVVMVFRNDYAVRMLAASVPAGIEAPIRIYVTESANGKVTVTYRSPTSIFAPYENAELDALARELDLVFSRIVNEAIAR